MKHVVCFSGGHSSALVAVEVVRRYGNKDVILLNHDINPSVEDPDIKRFKREVAVALGLNITFANHPTWDSKDQFDVCIEAKAFQGKAGQQLCTNRLKTGPFMKYLDQHFPGKECVLYYGFDSSETGRIQRRSTILSAQGFKSAYPLAFWERTIHSTSEIGVSPPLTYGVFKHANCTGCLKAGKQHWYLVYLHRPDLWEKALMAEEAIGYSIIKGAYLDELEPQFEAMKEAGITTTEHEDGRTFFARSRKVVPITTIEDSKPCECVF